MAKIVHNNIVDTINDILTQAKEKEVLKLESHDNQWTGRHMTIGDRQLVNFGTCGYLGLETHPKLIEGARSFASRYGTQFSVSRTYVTSSANIELEEKLSEIFDGQKTIAFSSTSLAHIAILPIVMNPEDAIILDQQAHVSMQTAAQLMAPKGVPIEIIRHSNLEMLERQIQSLRDKHSRIWYVIDGVYSMYGDIAPVEQLNELAKKYAQLHFYVDDAHGMSWTGKNGCGCVFETLKKNGKTIFVTTMAKGFGSIGGIVVFPEGHWYDRVILHGGPLAYSHPIAPAVMGASMASAEIHMSPEIVQLQNELDLKIKYCSALLEKSNLPIISNPKTPIFFVGTGQPNVGYNFNKRILDEGFYVNIGMFPAVPVKNTGLRFTVTNHVSLKEIEAFADALIYHYPKALEEGGKNVNEVRKAFHMPQTGESTKVQSSRNTRFSLQQRPNLHLQKKADLRVMVCHSIKDIDEAIWDAVFKGKGNFDHKSLTMMEEAFSQNDLIEENWKFHYILVYDNNELLVASFFSSGLFKDDLTAPVDVSMQLEEMRAKDPYYLCSKTLAMGSLFTEGEHLYIQRQNENWKEAIKLMLGELSAIRESEQANTIILRDFYSEDQELSDIFYTSGFFKVNLPNSNIIYDLDKIKESEFVESLSARSRRHIRNEVLKFEHHFRIEVASKISDDELKRAYDLFKNVNNNNFALNIFPYPFKLCRLINESEEWEFIRIYLNEKLVAVGFCYFANNEYFPILVGLDYEVNFEYKVYKQMLFRVAKRAMERGCKTIHFGFSADTEKRKLGARQLGNYGFVDVKDNFNFEIMNNMSANA